MQNKHDLIIEKLNNLEKLVEPKFLEDIIEQTYNEAYKHIYDKKTKIDQAKPYVDLFSKMASVAVMDGFVTKTIFNSVNKTILSFTPFSSIPENTATLFATKFLSILAVNLAAEPVGNLIVSGAGKIYDGGSYAIENYAEPSLDFLGSFFTNTEYN